MSRALKAFSLAAVVVMAAPVSAHHGFGRFDPTKEVTLQGTLTGIDFVNPHAYLYFDAMAADGKVQPMRCEMRAATVLRRSGWSEEMFVAGKHVEVSGNPHRDDPASCYIETLKLDDATFERYQQLTTATQARGDRPARAATGEPNIYGDWAQEQYLIARPPEGRGGLVPKSMIAGVESGQIAFADVPNAGWGARPVTPTPAGQAASDELRARPPEDSPRARCEITSILFDWVFDGPINRITKATDAITLEYGRGLTRTIHMNMTSHPASITPSRAGHSIGRWDGDTLVVDTVGFTPGIIAGTVAHSDRLHVVERFTLDPATAALKRDYTAEDPVNFTDQYAGSDTVMPADAPYAEDRCEELTYRNYSLEALEGRE
jgi:Family of unknown function (DUF6152)